MVEEEEDEEDEEDEEKEQKEQEKEQDEEDEDMGMDIDTEDVDMDKPAKGGWRGKKENKKGKAAKGKRKSGQRKKSLFSFFNFLYTFFVIRVKRYDNMVKWLNRDEDSPSDIDVWKIELDDYTLENLRIWLDNGGKLNNKGKGKAVGDEDKKKKKKRKSEF